MDHVGCPIQNVGVPSHTVKMSLLALTLVRVNMEDRSQDVKTFLQFIIFILIGALTFCAMYVSWRLCDNVLKKLIITSNTGDASFSKCYYNEAFIETFAHSSFVILPFYELVLYPICHRCLEMTKTLWKLLLGILLIAERI